MNRKTIRDLTVILITSISIIFFYYVRIYIIHHNIPPILISASYSDIVAIFRRMMLEIPTISSQTGVASLPPPYSGFFFEYPPLIVGIYYLSSMLALSFKILPLEMHQAMILGLILVPASYIVTFGVRRKYLPKQALVTIPILIIVATIFTGTLVSYFTIMSIFLSISLAVIQTSSIRIAEHYNIKQAYLLYAVLSPSLLYYTIYNFDVIMMMFFMLGIEYLLIDKKEKLGFILLGASVATKLLTALSVLLILIHRSRNIRDFINKTLYTATIPLITFIPIMVATPSVMKSINYVATFFCENCLWLPILSSEHDTLAKTLFIISFTISALILITLTIKLRKSDSELKILAVGMLPPIVLNYIFPPQYVLNLIPLLSLTAGIEIALIIISDIINVVAGPICIQLNSTPIGCFTNGSPAQKLFGIRNILLLVLFVVETIILIRTLKHKYSPDINNKNGGKFGTNTGI